MEETFEHIDALVAKMLAGEASSTEIAEVEAWAALSPSNRAFVADALKILAHTAAMSSDFQPDVDAAWQKVNAKITNEARVIELPKRNQVWSIAAAILLLTALTVIIKMAWSDSPATIETVVASTTEQTKTLTDGSVVRLSKQSELRFKAGEKGERIAELKGEADFTVVHDDLHPFVVVTEGVMVRDIGTVFHVKAIEGSEIVEVAVTEGEVHFYVTENSGINLTKGEAAIYNKRTKTFERLTPAATEVNSSASAKLLEFNETPLSEVIHRIELMYACDIVLANPALKDCKLTVTFQEEQLENILDVIAETLELSIEQKGLQFIISGKVCQ